MDPITVANTFATLVQLIAMFKQERQNSKESDDKAFLDWLEYHRHERLKTFITNTANVQVEIIALLRQDSVLILSQLDSINTTLGALLSHVESFKGLYNAILPNAGLSDQAISVLRQLVNSGSEYFWRLQQFGHPESFNLDGRGPIAIPEPRFINDDLRSLENLGLLVPRTLSRGVLAWGITRQAVALIEQIDGGGAVSS